MLSVIHLSAILQEMIKISRLVQSLTKSWDLFHPYVLGLLAKRTGGSHPQPSLSNNRYIYVYMHTNEKAIIIQFDRKIYWNCGSHPNLISMSISLWSFLWHFVWLGYISQVIIVMAWNYQWNQVRVDINWNKQNNMPEYQNHITKIIHSFIHSFNFSFIHLFIHSFIHSFIEVDTDFHTIRLNPPTRKTRNYLTYTAEIMASGDLLTPWWLSD